MGVWHVEDGPKADRAVQLIGDVSSQTSLSESVLILEGSACSQASDMCHEQTRGERPTRTPPHRRPREATMVRYTMSYLCLVVFWQDKVNPAAVCMQTKPACEDHV